MNSTTPAPGVAISIGSLRISLPAALATRAWIAGFSAALPRELEQRLAQLPAPRSRIAPHADKPALILSPAALRARPGLSGPEAAAWVASHIADAASRSLDAPHSPQREGA